MWLKVIPIIRDNFCLNKRNSGNFCFQQIRYCSLSKTMKKIICICSRKVTSEDLSCLWTSRITCGSWGRDWNVDPDPSFFTWKFQQLCSASWPTWDVSSALTKLYLIRLLFKIKPTGNVSTSPETQLPQLIPFMLVHLKHAQHAQMFVGDRNVSNTSERDFRWYQFWSITPFYAIVNSAHTCSD